jgi:hypothetical protein
MRNLIKKTISTAGLLLCLLMLSFTGNAQVAGTHFTVGLANVTSTSNTMEMDLIITVDGVNTRLAGFQAGINYNTAIIANWVLLVNHLFLLLK